MLESLVATGDSPAHAHTLKMCQNPSLFLLVFGPLCLTATAMPLIAVHALESGDMPVEAYMSMSNCGEDRYVTVRDDDKALKPSRPDGQGALLKNELRNGSQATGTIAKLS